MARIVSAGRGAAPLPVVLAIVASVAVVGGASGALAWTVVALGGVAFTVIVTAGARLQRPPAAEPVRPLGDTYEQVVIAAPKAADLAEDVHTRTDAA